MSTESSFSFTIKFNGDLLTVRGETYTEFTNNLVQMYNIKEFATLIAALEGEAPKSSAQAIKIIEDSLGPVDVISEREEPTASTSSIEEKQDKFGNRYVNGMAGAQTCVHGPRVVKYGTSKAGKKYKAHVCVNDSPFGDWKQDKCETVWG